MDNGSIRFSGVRVPRENLLDRFGSVDSSGQYRSPYSASRRFAATLGELTGGRVGLTCSSLGVLKVRPCLTPSAKSSCDHPLKHWDHGTVQRHHGRFHVPCQIEALGLGSSASCTHWDSAVCTACACK